MIPEHHTEKAALFLETILMSCVCLLVAVMTYKLTQEKHAPSLLIVFLGASIVVFLAYIAALLYRLFKLCYPKKNVKK